MAAKLSLKITVVLIAMLALILTLFAAYIISSRTAAMEEELLAKGRLATVTQAKMMEQILSGAVKSGKFSEADIFDDQYIPIPNTDPAKYHTHYDRFLDETIQDIEDEYLQDEQIVYAVLVDRNGYLPTHHRRFSLPLTGDREKDSSGNRTKRLFNKKEELEAARSREPFTKQQHTRDTGERIWALAAPVYVNGRHWGAVRVGLSMAKIEQRIGALRLQIIVAVLIMLVIASFTIVLVVRKLTSPLLRLTDTARRIAAGDLNANVLVESRDEIGTLADALRRMTNVIVKTLRDEIDKSRRLFDTIGSAISQLSTSAGNLLEICARQSSGSAQQASAVQEVTVTAEEIAVTAKQITDNAKTVESMAEEANRCCIIGTNDIINATEGMVILKVQVMSIAECMLQLGENSQKVSGVVEIIDEISDQTNLLALNAAIEAAGAGESGKRFSIVAREVRRLAERTVEATKQIRGLISEIQQATNSTIMVTEEGTKAVDSAGQLVNKVQQSIATIMTTVEGTAMAAKEISLSTQQQTSACEQLAETMTEVRDVAQQSADGARDTEQALSQITDFTERLKELMAEEIQIKGKIAAMNGARMMEKVLNDALSCGRFTPEEIFDEQYIPIPGTSPQKFRTRYDGYLDETIQSMEDEFLTRDTQCIYAVLVDRNGYLPTHNSKYSQPLTGDRRKDKHGNRTKRKFDSPDELAAARNSKDEVLIQVYFRDTGEKIWNISSPVTVNGSHWGSFKIGYSL